MWSASTDTTQQSWSYSTCTLSRASTTGEVIDEPECGHDRVRHRATGGGQLIEYPLADRLDRIERLGNISDQNPRVIVRLVQRHPRERLICVCGERRAEVLLWPGRGRNDLVAEADVPVARIGYVGSG